MSPEEHLREYRILQIGILHILVYLIAELADLGCRPQIDTALVAVSPVGVATGRVIEVVSQVDEFVRKHVLIKFFPHFGSGVLH